MWTTNLTPEDRGIVWFWLCGLLCLPVGRGLPQPHTRGDPHQRHEHKDRHRTNPCQTTQPHFLLRQMGPAFDTKRMALDNPHNLTGIRREKKRSKRSWESASGYAQEDDAMRTMGQEEDDNMEDEWEDLEEWLEDDDQWLEEDDGGSDLGGVQTLHDLIRARRDSPQNTKNPHKKRRNDKPNKDQRRHSKKHRKERRGQASDTEHTRKWHCEMKEVWKKMPEGYFPPYIQTGKCRQTTCLDGKFQCTPRKYAIQVLKRDPHSCLPVPLTLDSTTYEESWSFVDHKVTVCCECSQPVAILGHS